REVKVHLDGGALPCPAEDIFDLDVNLGTVENAFPGVCLERKVPIFQSRLQSRGRPLPVFERSDIFFGPGGKINLVIPEPESLKDEESEVDHFSDFFLQLIRPAEKVRVVLRKSPDAQEAVKDARTFVTVNRTQFSPAEGEVPVTPELGFVDQDMER